MATGSRSLTFKELNSLSMRNSIKGKNPIDGGMAKNTKNQNKRLEIEKNALSDG